VSVAVLAPFTPGACEWRDRAWENVQRHYATNQHGWPVHIGTCDGPWSKGRAVADALEQTDADVLVITDADVWTRPSALDWAVTNCQTWAIPHKRVHRLTPEATEQTYAGTPGRETWRNPYRGVAGGGLTVITREAFLRCPIDPRFYGWGGEDVAWGWALDRLYGPPPRGEAVLWHLWHPPATVGHVGSPESSALVQRWRTAGRNPLLLDLIIDEAREALWRPSSVSAEPA
jgi:hypothetical protein